MYVVFYSGMATLLSISVLAVVVLRLFWTLAAKFNHARKARRWGCAPYPTYPSDLLGIGLLKETLAADKADVLCPMFERRIAHISAREGRHVATLSWMSLGRETCFTIDPENVRAVWATQFKDFVAGNLRWNVSHQLAGKNIVSLPVRVIVCLVWAGNTNIRHAGFYRRSGMGQIQGSLAPTVFAQPDQ